MLSKFLWGMRYCHTAEREMPKLNLNPIINVSTFNAASSDLEALMSEVLLDLSANGIRHTARIQEVT